LSKTPDLKVRFTKIATTVGQAHTPGPNCEKIKVVMISVSNVSMRYGSKILFEDVSTTFTPGRRYGLTGPNGAGKTTFMKVLSGDLDPQKGVVVRPRKLGVLRQDQYAFDAYRVIDTVIMGNKGLWAALEERDRIYEKAELDDAD
jgi:ATPase subunit of ABC transporter with duplicated ATPase domains